MTAVFGSHLFPCTGPLAQVQDAPELRWTTDSAQTERRDEATACDRSWHLYAGIRTGVDCQDSVKEIF